MPRERPSGCSPRRAARRACVQHRTRRSSAERGDRGANPLGEFALFVVGEHEHSLGLRHERVELLLVVRHSGWERGNVPMHVRVPLLAAETQHVDALRRHDGRRRARDAVDHSLEREVLVGREIVGDSLG